MYGQLDERRRVEKPVILGEAAQRHGLGRRVATVDGPDFSQVGPAKRGARFR